MMIQTILSIFNLLHHLRTFPSLVCLCTQILCSHLIFKSLKFIIISIEHLLASLSSIIFNIIIMMLLLLMLYFIVDTQRYTWMWCWAKAYYVYIVVARIKKEQAISFFHVSLSPNESAFHSGPFSILCILRRAWDDFIFRFSLHHFVCPHFWLFFSLFYGNYIGIIRIFATLYGGKSSSTYFRKTLF